VAGISGDVDPAQLLDCPVDHRPAGLLLAQVGGDGDAASTSLLDEPDRGVTVLLLALQVDDEDISALAREGDRDARPIPESPPVMTVR